VLIENNCKLRLLDPARISFITEVEIKTFHDKEKQKQFMNNKSVLQKILKEILKIRGKINLNRQVNKQTQNRKESSTTKTTKWQELLNTFEY
jgi:hypothetical protein